ncbi:MAG: sigma-54-dependent Fis family transcriptional regulator [bacterium]|nr:sigma-54-dependent Fis family transcriptional regulator [bacterium]
MRTILVVDDEASARYALKRVFDPEHRVLEASSVEEARAAINTELPDVVLLDYSMPGEDGLVLLRELRGIACPPAVIMVTAHGSERVAVEAMRIGAYDYLSKPYDLEELRITVSRALERQELYSEVRSLRETLAHEGQFGRMIGSSPGMQELFETAARVAPTDLSVMLLGESGTGKDILAQEIHSRSPRAKRPVVAVNCAALPEARVESELFGCEKGAFTGAVQSRAGRFELANGGTLFLDEIGDMPLHLQPKILRAAEEGTVHRIGAAQPVHVDARLISATNRDLQESIRGGEFREDLYYRLAGVVLRLPPLRERRDDILLLAERFWSDLAQKHGHQGPELTQEALLGLRAAPWPGNVRQLRNTMEQLFVLARGDTVRTGDVTATLDLDRKGPAEGAGGPFAAADFRDARRQFETEYLRRKLEENGGNVTRTAAAIGIERQTLQEKIKKLGVVRG